MSSELHMPPEDLVAKTGPFAGMNTFMAIASMVMILGFVGFTIVDVEYSSAIFSKGKKCFAQAVPSAPGEFSNRKDFPAAWAGLCDEAFSEAAGIPDGIFCHQGAFLCATGSFESTLKLVKDAIKA